MGREGSILYIFANFLGDTGEVCVVGVGNLSEVIFNGLVKVIMGDECIVCVSGDCETKWDTDA